MYACMSPPCPACAQSCLSQKWQPPVGKKKGVNIGEVREAAAASRGWGGGGSVMYWKLLVRSKRMVSKSGMGLPGVKKA